MYVHAYIPIAKEYINEKHNLAYNIYLHFCIYNDLVLILHFFFFYLYVHCYTVYVCIHTYVYIQYHVIRIIAILRIITVQFMPKHAHVESNPNLFLVSLYSKEYNMATLINYLLTYPTLSLFPLIILHALT